MTKRVLYPLIFWCLLMAILVLSLLPIEHPDVSPNDKVNHLLGYGALMVFGYLAYERLKLVAGALVVFGGLVEVLQGMTGYRYMSLADLVANSAGIALVCAGIFIIKRIIIRFNLDRNE